MSSIKLSEPILVTRAEALRRMVENFRSAPILAVDTESNSLYAYQERVCLIQFSILGVDYLVDPLALEDLSPLAPLFKAPGIEKIFHAAEYDLLCLKRDFGFEFESLFDTMLAARMVGREAIGLGSMLQEEFGVELNKRFQRANWGQRPLPPDQLDYARLDTHYLIPLRDRLKAALESNGLWQLAKEDFQRLSVTRNNQKDSNKGDQHAVDPWRVSGSYDLEPQQAAVLLELCRYRDQKARNLDRPLFKILGDKTLLEVAARTPSGLEQLPQINGMSPKQIRRHGKPVLQAVRRGLASKPIYPPRPPKPDYDYLWRLDALREWRRQTARRMELKSDVVMPRDLLQRLAKDNPKNYEQLAHTLNDTPWRLEHFGEQLLKTISK